MSLVVGTNVIVPFVIPSTELLAGTPINLVAPVAGYINEIVGIIQTAIGTGGDITVQIGTTAVTGLALTIADSATVGTVVSDTPTAAAPDNRYVEKGERIQVIPAAAFATTGAVNGHLVINTGK